MCSANYYKFAVMCLFKIGKTLVNQHQLFAKAYTAKNFTIIIIGLVWLIN